MLDHSIRSNFFSLSHYPGLSKLSQLDCEMLLPAKLKSFCYTEVAQDVDASRLEKFNRYLGLTLTPCVIIMGFRYSCYLTGDQG